MVASGAVVVPSRPIAECFRHMLNRDGDTVGEIRNRACNAKHPMKRPGGEMQLVACLREECPGRGREMAVPLEPSPGNFALHS